jgi:hypothetical protein|nr:MAG TPA: hypothetical protein [Caudoviricetes sp.]
MKNSVYEYKSANREKFFKKILWHKFDLAVIDDNIEIMDYDTFVMIRVKALEIKGIFFNDKEMFDKWVEENKENFTCLSIKINLLDLIILTNENYS